MKKILKNIVLVAITLNLTCCTEILEEELFNSPNLNDFYKSEAEADLALAGIYSVFWTHQGIYKDLGLIRQNGFTSDLIQSRNNDSSWDQFSWSMGDNDFSNHWIGAYLAINRSNTLIDRIAVSDVSDEVKNEYSAKAKFMRALYYFNLVRAFGGVPVHTKATLDVADNDILYKARNTEAEVYAQIIKDLTEAEIEIGEFDADDHAVGHVTLGAIKGLLAKVYLQNRDWSKAAAKAKEVMDMGVYELFPDYSDIYRPSKKNGSEHIFSGQHGSQGGDGNNNIGNHTPNHFVPAATKLPDGTQVRWEINGRSTGIAVDQDFFDSTPDTHRKYHTMRDYMPFYWKSTDNGWVYEEGHVALEFPQIMKYYFPDATSTIDLGVNINILRYSDILLIYAEAVNEDVGPTTDAYEAINKVRRRARAVGTEFEQDESVYPDLTDLTKDEFRDAVLLERAREFIAEGDRRNDLNRHEVFVENAQNRGVTVPHPGYRLFPIPSFHINQNPNLEQNPGY